MGASSDVIYVHALDGSSRLVRRYRRGMSETCFRKGRHLQKSRILNAFSQTLWMYRNVYWSPILKINGSPHKCLANYTAINWQRKLTLLQWYQPDAWLAAQTAPSKLGILRPDFPSRGGSVRISMPEAREEPSRSGCKTAHRIRKQCPKVKGKKKQYC